MIPILYSENETTFASEGIGPLSDVLSCYVEEERNGSYELELEYPVTGILFSEIKTGRVILAKASDSGDWQPFDIYNVSPSMDGVVTVNAEHVSYRLSGIPVEPFSATGIVSALQGLKQHSLISNPFTVWTDIDNATTKFSVKLPQSFRACLGGTDGSILDTYSGSRGCELEFDRFQVKVHAHRGQNNGVVIEYGKNLTDLEQEEDISECYTGVLAYWKDSQDDEQMLWSDIQYIENHTSYPRERIYVLDASNDFDQDTEVTKQLLNERAAEYGADNDIGRPSVNLTVSFINLAQTAEFADSAPIESVRLCDEVTVYFPLLGVDVTTQVIRTKYDSILERYDEIELGDVKSSFADTIKQSVNESVVKPAVDDTKSIFSQALKYATDKLTGAYGGHVVIGRNENGEPNEIYIMDTDSVETAQTVLRINMNGIGGSTTGINGPYNVAILTDGTINASQITSGTIDGNLIRGGTIMAGALDEVLNNKIDKNIQSVKVQYAMNQSQTEAPATGWQDDAPEWQEGHYIWQRTETMLADGTTTYSDALCITGVKGDSGQDGKDGKDAIVLFIDSSNGTMFKNSAIATTLTVTIVYGDQIITNATQMHEHFGESAALQWKYKRMGETEWTPIPSTDPDLNDEGFIFTIQPSDVLNKTVFSCELNF